MGQGDKMTDKRKERLLKMFGPYFLRHVPSQLHVVNMGENYKPVKPHITYQYGDFLGAFRYRAQVHYNGRVWTDFGEDLPLAMQRAWLQYITRI